MVPETEIRERIGRLQKLLQEEGIELALLRQNADLYYFAGTVQDCHMLIPAVGDPILLVWRVCERAAAESPVRRIEPLHGLSRLREIVRKYRFDRPRKIGLEMDVLPAELYIYYTERVWPSTPVAGITHLVRTVRSRKSRWELEQIRSASDQIAGAVKQVPEILRPGITELEFASEIESVLRKTGHPGYLRMRGWNQEMGMGQILSGPEGAVPAWINTPAGGTGINPAFGQSSCLRRILPGEPVTVDLGGSFQGYFSDQTRTFCIHGLPDFLVEAYQCLLELHHGIEDRLVPGAVCSDIYDWAMGEMEAADHGERFMGFQGSQVRFVGHGVGVEIDEYPFLAAKNRMRLAPDMVVAVEPKLAFREVGLIGIEDTYLIGEAGAERLTSSPQEIIVC